MSGSSQHLQNPARESVPDLVDGETVLKIDGVTGPVFVRPIDHDEYDYEVVYTGGSLTECETSFAVETLLADHGGEVVPINESPFASDGSDTAVMGRGVR